MSISYIVKKATNNMFVLIDKHQAHYHADKELASSKLRHMGEKQTLVSVSTNKWQDLMQMKRHANNSLYINSK